MKSRTKYILIIGSGLLLILVIPFLGIIDLDFSRVFSNDPDSFIFWQLRFPRTILAFLAGSSLALGGLIFQNIFKNSLATPYTLGVSSGAAAGTVAALKLNLAFSLFGINFIYIAGFTGGILSILLILGISRVTKSYSVYTILMSGVAINFFFSAFILLLQYMVDITQTVSVLRWLMGSISAARYKDIMILFPAWLFFVTTAMLLNKELVLISGGESFAASRGLDVKKFRVLLFVIVSLITGIIVSITGPIGFIGLIIPHIARQLIKDDFRLLVVVTVISGGILLSIADLLARILKPPAEIPVGIITAFFGAPFFLYILISSLRKKI